MSDNFLGEIRMFGGNFAISNWAFCNGQLLSIAQNQALFSLIGTTYGGDGVQTFALPDLRGRLPLGQGQGIGLSPRAMGEMAGVEQVTVLLNEMPLHSHGFNATADAATTAEVGPIVLPAQPTASSAFLYTVPGSSPGTPAILAPTVVGLDGGSQPHSNLMPSLCLTFIIALTGIYPSRN
jgi:microcystin-dependent protein